MNDKSINLLDLASEVTGADDIRQSWKVILQTVKGSDPLRPDFGCGIFDYIGKPINQFTGEIIAQITKDLEKWEKRCVITSVKLSYNLGQITVKIVGTYMATKSSVEASISLSDLLVETLTNTLIASYSNDYNDLQYS